MIDFDEALAVILRHCAPLPAAEVPLSAAGGRFLVEDVTAPEAVPRFSSSSVDGYAVRAADTAHASSGNPVQLPVQGTLFAGEEPIAALRRGRVMRIMTGAVMPRGADAVVMQEDARESGGMALLTAPAAPGANVRPKGGEYRKGQVVLPRGTRITPPAAGLLATLGRARVKTGKPPRVAVLVTGNELRPAGAPLRPGEIYDANSPALAAALRAMGIEPVPVARVRDSLRGIETAIAAALRGADILLTAGGVSVGERDHVREALDRCRVETHFWRVAMKPGKPNFFGTRGRRMVFGLPGNPVSALLSFHLLVRPAIERCMGAGESARPAFEAVLERDLRKAAGRLEFVRMRLFRNADGGLRAAPAAGQDSHMLGGLAHAEGLYRFGKDMTFIAAGSRIAVEPIAWSMP